MLVIIRGLPGSGKSTLAKMFEAQGYVHVERDLWRYSDTGEYKYDRNKNQELKAKVGDTAYIMLKAGWDVVVSDCNEAAALICRVVRPRFTPAARQRANAFRREQRA